MLYWFYKSLDKKMLRILTLFLGIFCTSIASFAANSDMEDRKFYLKATANKGFFQNHKVSQRNVILKYQNNAAINAFDIGGGYYFNNEFRGEVLVHQEINNKFSSKAPSSLTKVTKSTKNELSALMLGINMNVIDFDYGQIFLSGSMGVAHIKEKINYSGTRIRTGTRLAGQSYKGKSQNNFAYGLGVGADFKLSERLHGEIAYRYNNFGKTHFLRSSLGSQIGETKLRSHNALIGLRVDM